MSNAAAAERNLAVEAVRVTEATALAASRRMGHGDEENADRAAVDAMHRALSNLYINGTIRIGEGTREETDRLYAGEQVGSGEGPKVDVALLPLEGPTIIAKGEPNGLSVLAMAQEGGFLSAPDIYMDKIAVGGSLPAGVVDLDADPGSNLAELAKARGVDVGDLVVCALDRPRHKELIARIREAGARIMLIGDGDVSGVIATTQPDSGVDIYMGIGGAREGVLAASALSCVGGQMQARLVFRDDAERARAVDAGIEDLECKYDVGDMASGDVTFATTAVTSGAMLRGVRTDVGRRGIVITNSIVMRSHSGTVRYVEAHHNFARKAAPGDGA